MSLYIPVNALDVVHMIAKLSNYDKELIAKLKQALLPVLLKAPAAVVLEHCVCRDLSKKVHHKILSTLHRYHVSMFHFLYTYNQVDIVQAFYKVTATTAGNIENWKKIALNILDEPYVVVDYKYALPVGQRLDLLMRPASILFDHYNRLPSEQQPVAPIKVLRSALDPVSDIYSSVAEVLRHINSEEDVLKIWNIGKKIAPYVWAVVRTFRTDFSKNTV